MKNQVGREIPDEILARMGKTGYRGLHDRDNASYRKASPTVRALNDPQRGKLCASLREALEKCDCMTACISASTTISAMEIM